jgi:hypothetical protein
MLVYYKVIWNVSRPFGIFYGHLVMFGFVGIFFTVLVLCIEKNLATLRCHLYLIQSGFVPNMYIPTADTEKGGKLLSSFFSTTNLLRLHLFLLMIIKLFRYLKITRVAFALSNNTFCVTWGQYYDINFLRKLKDENFCY